MWAPGTTWSGLWKRFPLFSQLCLSLYASLIINLPSFWKQVCLLWICFRNIYTYYRGQKKWEHSAPVFPAMFLRYTLNGPDEVIFLLWLMLYLGYGIFNGFWEANHVQSGLGASDGVSLPKAHGMSVADAWIKFWALFEGESILDVYTIGNTAHLWKCKLSGVIVVWGTRVSRKYTIWFNGCNQFPLVLSHVYQAKSKWHFHFPHHSLINWECSDWFSQWLYFSLWIKALGSIHQSSWARLGLIGPWKNGHPHCEWR